MLGGIFGIDSALNLCRPIIYSISCSQTLTETQQYISVYLLNWNRGTQIFIYITFVTLNMLNTAQTYQACHHHIEFHFLVTKYFHFCKVLITRENTGSFLAADCGIKVTKKEILSWNSTSTFKQLSINPQIIFSVTWLILWSMKYKSSKLFPF